MTAPLSGTPVQTPQSRGEFGLGKLPRHEPGHAVRPGETPGEESGRVGAALTRRADPADSHDSHPTAESNGSKRSDPSAFPMPSLTRSRRRELADGIRTR